MDSEIKDLTGNKDLYNLTVPNMIYNRPDLFGGEPSTQYCKICFIRL